MMFLNVIKYGDRTDARTTSNIRPNKGGSTIDSLRIDLLWEGTTVDNGKVSLYLTGCDTLFFKTVEVKIHECFIGMVFEVLGSRFWVQRSTFNVLGSRLL